MGWFKRLFRGGRRPPIKRESSKPGHSELAAALSLHDPDLTDKFARNVEQSNALLARLGQQQQQQQSLVLQEMQRQYDQMRGGMQAAAGQPGYFPPSGHSFSSGSYIREEIENFARSGGYWGPDEGPDEVFRTEQLAREKEAGVICLECGGRLTAKGEPCGNCERVNNLLTILNARRAEG